MDRRWILFLASCSGRSRPRVLADGFGSLLVLTIGIAVGEAMPTPVVYSLIPDLFSGKRRELANFIFLGMPLDLCRMQ
ncbi:hypothetical protein [Sphingopyxis granuli]|uniref:hypothetical protein n=1 Tax=Sphingopyxis granuli TaxID=267128 RepID=UPI00301E0554